MGTLLRGLQSVLIALGIIAIIGTGIILYYNVVKPEDPQAQTAAVSTESTESTESSIESSTSETEPSAVPVDTRASGDSAAVFSVENGHEHTYTSTVLRPATCTEAGEVRYDCYCGDYYVDSIPALEHKPGDWVTVRAATTSQTGLRQKSCTVCGRVVQEETLPMLPSTTTTTNTSTT